MTTFEKDTHDFLTLLQKIYDAKNKISVLLSDSILSHYKKYCKAYVRMPDQHKTVLTKLFSEHGEKIIEGLDFLDNTTVNLPFAEGVKGSEKLKIHLSSFYRMAKEITEYYSKSTMAFPMIGSEESKMLLIFKIRFYKMIQHVVILEKDRNLIQKRIDEINGTTSDTNDSSPFGAMIQMMSGMFNQLGLNQPGTDSLLKNVKNVVESQETKKLVEDIGNEIGQCQDFGTTLTKVVGKLSDPKFTGKIMDTVNGIMPGVIPPGQAPPDLSGMMSGLQGMLPQLMNGLQTMGVASPNGGINPNILSQLGSLMPQIPANGQSTTTQSTPTLAITNGSSETAGETKTSDVYF